jgi:subtilisin family serine protease
MGKRKILLFMLVLSSLLILPGYAKPFVPDEVWPTWDLDMVNIEGVEETGDGVYIAVLDTGLVPYWRDYFPEDRVAAKLGTGFYEPCHADPETGLIVESGKVHKTTFIGSTGSTHGTHVTSTILGYYYRTPVDAVYGYPLPAIKVDGVAPDVTIIPVKVLADYSFPKWSEYPGHNIVFGTDKMVAAGIRYAADLAEDYSPMIITMSLGGPEPSVEIKAAIDYAIGKGVIVVAAAGNAGMDGMDYPGAYEEVISVGSCGWEYEWWWPDTGSWPASPDTGENGPDEDYINTYYPLVDGRNRLWWLQSGYNGWRDVAEGNDLVDEVYISDFSSREGPGQFLDVVAPGSWVRGPFPGTPGYAHLPWWSQGWGSLMGWNPGNYYYVGGTSMATPHVAGIAALMLEKNPGLSQSDVETYLKSSALDIPMGSMLIVDYNTAIGSWDWVTVEWEQLPGEEATGAGLVQADQAIQSVPSP